MMIKPKYFYSPQVNVCHSDLLETSLTILAENIEMCSKRQQWWVKNADIQLFNQYLYTSTSTI